MEWSGKWSQTNKATQSGLCMRIMAGVQHSEVITPCITTYSNKWTAVVKPPQEQEQTVM